MFSHIVLFLDSFQISSISFLSSYLSLSNIQHSFTACSLLFSLTKHSEQKKKISFLNLPLLHNSFNRYLSLLTYHVYTSLLIFSLKLLDTYHILRVVGLDKHPRHSLLQCFFELLSHTHTAC